VVVSAIEVWSLAVPRIDENNEDSEATIRVGSRCVCTDVAVSGGGQGCPPPRCGGCGFRVLPEKVVKNRRTGSPHPDQDDWGHDLAFTDLHSRNCQVPFGSPLPHTAPPPRAPVSARPLVPLAHHLKPNRLRIGVDDLHLPGLFRS